MPLLPRKNSLDFNPDATILASKKLSAIALENLKNPLEDPDKATLSTLQAQKNLSTSFNTLEEMAGQYHSLVLRLGNLLFTGQADTLREGAGRKKKGKKMKGGAGEYDAMFPDDSSVDTGSTISVREFNRNPAYYIRDDGSVSSGFSNFSDLSDYFGRPNYEQFFRNLEEDRQRFRGFYRDDDRNSTATPSTNTTRTSTGVPVYPYDDPNEPPIDDEDASTITTRRSLTPSENYRRHFGMAIPEALRAGETAGANFNSLVFPLIQLTRKMNILVNSSIKPAITSLSQPQVSKLTDIYKMVRASYNDVVRPQQRSAQWKLRLDPKDPFTKVKRNERDLTEFGINDLEESIIAQNQFGDEMLSTWNQERQNLLLNLTIVINSWRQNTPTGQQTYLNERLNESFQNTATRLGAKAELVDLRQAGLAGTDYEQRVLNTIDDNLSTGLDFGGRPQDIPYEPIPDDRSIQQLRQYDAQGNLIGQGRKPRGRPRKTGAMTLVGNGRNFYGDQINTSRDLPTIFSGALRNCPTKYLL